MRSRTLANHPASVHDLSKSITTDDSLEEMIDTTFSASFANSLNTSLNTSIETDVEYGGFNNSNISPSKNVSKCQSNQLINTSTTKSKNGFNDNGSSLRSSPASRNGNGGSCVDVSSSNRERDDDPSSRPAALTFWQDLQSQTVRNGEPGGCNRIGTNSRSESASSCATESATAAAPSGAEFSENDTPFR